MRLPAQRPDHRQPNYPSDFVVFSLGQLLVSQETSICAIHRGDLSNPGAFHGDNSYFHSGRRTPYIGKIVILVDEVTQSSAEYHAWLSARLPSRRLRSMTAGATEQHGSL